jgi:hypothetical protein
VRVLPAERQRIVVFENGKRGEHEGLPKQVISSKNIHFFLFTKRKTDGINSPTKQ